MPRHGRRRRDSSSSSSYSSDLDSFQGGFNLRMHRRPLDVEYHRRRAHSTVRRVRGKNGDVYIDIQNRQNLSPPRSRSRSRSRTRSRMRSVSRHRVDMSDIEEEIERIQREIRRGRRRQEEQEALLRQHQLQQQQQWAAPPHRRTRSNSPVDRAEFQLMYERLRRERLEEQLRELQSKQNDRERQYLVPPREIRGRSRHRSRHRSKVRYSSSSSDDDDGSDSESVIRERIRRARSRARDEAEMEFELRRLRKKEHEENARRHVEDAMLVERMKALEQQQAEKEHEAKIREKIEAERARQEAEEAERKKYEAKLKKEAVEEHLRREAARELAEKEAKEKLDKEVEERMKPLLIAQGYTDQEVEDILKGVAIPPPAQVKAVKVHSDDISPDALNRYHLNWEWEQPRTSGWIIVHHDLSQAMIDQLTDLTRHLRQRALPPPPPAADRPNVVELRVNDRDRDKIYLVRKKRNGLSRLFSLV
ncbi:hypothetical protein VTO42DRAFT_2412 [Malbranchea cinnamomea]